jgi:hypothetical protein
MTDTYVYHFLRLCRSNGQSILSRRRATLKAIKSIGEPVMESQIVVDHTEVDSDGFLIGEVSGDSPMDELWAQIRSLEKRANSRDTEALAMDESTNGAMKYMLRLESRELRAAALRLKKQYTRTAIKKLDTRRPAQDSPEFGGNLAGHADSKITERA